MSYRQTGSDIAMRKSWACLYTGEKAWKNNKSKYLQITIERQVMNFTVNLRQYVNFPAS